MRYRWLLAVLLPALAVGLALAPMMGGCSKSGKPPPGSDRKDEEEVTGPPLFEDFTTASGTGAGTFS